jgi:hypothetical protein
LSGVVSDASPLIALQQIGQLSLLGSIFGTVLIPSAVLREVTSVEWPAEALPSASASGDRNTRNPACSEAQEADPRCPRAEH